MSSMNCMGENFSLKSQEICSIIEECGNHGVKHFKLGELEILFGESEKEKPTPQVSEQNPIVLDNAQDSIEEFRSITEEDTVRELKAEELAIMQIADPLKYEELLANPEQIQEFSHEVEQD